MESKKNIIIYEQNRINVLNRYYMKEMNGIPNINVGVEKQANDDLRKHQSVEQAVSAMIKNQVQNCTTSGCISRLL